MKYDGIHKHILNSTHEWDLETQINLLRNIVLVGGSLGFEGFKERLFKEIKDAISNWSL